jgi:hypothetical protein
LLISWRGRGPAGDNDGSCSDQRAESIPIARTRWFWGGTRCWLLCPGAGCGRRVLKLYFARGRFQCRSCGRVIYQTQYEKPWQQAARRAKALRQRLGIAAVGVNAPLPEVPADMPVEVYAQQLEEILRAEIAAEEGRTEQLQQLVFRIPPQFVL